MWRGGCRLNISVAASFVWRRASRRICGWRAAVQMASAAKAFLFLAALTTKSVGKLGRSPPETIVLTWPPAETYAPKYDKAVECLTKDRDALLAFYDFPAEHWKHLRSTNPIESTFATVRHRTSAVAVNAGPFQQVT